MSEVVGLIREFPFGSLIIILSLIWAVERAVSSFANRNKPDCECECCVCEVDDEKEEEED